MSVKTSKYTPEQLRLVEELQNAYGLKPDDVIFYNDKPEPFFTYEATCQLCNQLTEIKDIDLDPVTQFQNTTAMRCRFTFENGSSRSAVGLVNHSEKIEEQPMNENQRVALASARAIRNTLKASGINLLTAHYQIKNSGEIINQPRENELRKKLLAEVHVLAEESGFISGHDKTPWRNLLSKRYLVWSSKDLSENELSDLVAFLRSCQQKAA